MKNLRALEMKSVVIVYGGLLALSPLFAWYSWGNPFYPWNISHAPSFASLLIGFFLVAIYFAASLFTLRFLRFGADLEKLFRQVLTPLSYFQILLLALLSGLLEEWFFRGLLMNSLGLGFSSIAFALAHLLPGRRVWLWSIWCLFAGLSLGWLYKQSGSLGLVVLVHSSVNALLLARLNSSSAHGPAYFSS